MTNLTELKQAAEAATPGPWILAKITGDVMHAAPSKKHPNGWATLLWADDDGESVKARGEHDLQFIALANPATILKLIAVAEDMQELTKPDRRGSYQWFRDFAAKSLKELES